jgi:exopolyphosphatase/guanosine-5'-triphosphate,3'-diphosphate pyrophosphatase
MVVRTIGVAPEVVSGDEEARLSFSGAVVGLPGDTPAPYLVVDIGGGSTEFVVGHHTVDAAVSVDIGCVRMTERHLHADPAEPDQIAAAEADIMAGVEQALAAVPAERARALVGLAGSVTTVAALALELDSYRPDLIHHAVIRYEDVASITWRLLGLSRAERLRLPVMHPGRADVIGAGALVLAVIMRRLGMGSVIASEHDILDGICYSLLR